MNTLCKTEKAVYAKLVEHMSLADYITDVDVAMLCEQYPLPWLHLGSGSEAIAFELSNGQAIRISLDGISTEYYESVQKMNNPFVPQVFDVSVVESEYGHLLSIVSMETLEQVSEEEKEALGNHSPNWVQLDNDQMRRAHPSFLFFTTITESYSALSAYHNIERLRENPDKVKQFPLFDTLASQVMDVMHVVQRLYNKYNSAIWDTHQYDIMKRKSGQIVIIDPIA